MQNNLTVKPYAVLCGAIFACVRHASHEMAARYVLAKSFSTGEPIELSEEVEVIECGSDEIVTFDPEELMKAAGGIFPANRLN